MKTYRLFLVILFAAFYSCAVQNPPTGGPINDNALEFTRAEPPYRTIEIDPTESINLVFNQMINPQNVKQSFKVYPEIDININVIGNKIKIYPKDVWPNGLFKIIGSKEISDYYGNILSEPIELSYSTTAEMPKTEIYGTVVNFDSTKSYAVGLFMHNISDKELDLYYSVELDNQGDFNFKNIKSENYVLAVINNTKIDNIYDDIRNFNYCVKIPNNFNSSKKSISNNLYLYDSAQKLNLKELVFKNLHYGEIILNNGDVKSFIANNNYYNSDLFNENIIKINFPIDADSIDIALLLDNNIEDYYSKKRFYNKLLIEDDIAPRVQSVNRKSDSLYVLFSEPIIVNDSILKQNYDFLNPFEIKFFNYTDSSNVFHLVENSIADLMNNALLDTQIVLSQTNIDNIVIGGNVFGEVLYSGARDIIVELKNSKDNYKVNTNSGQFAFNNIIPGFYSIWAYENINKSNDNYFNGKLEPVHTNALFGIYEDTIEIRPKWDVEGIKIKID